MPKSKKKKNCDFQKVKLKVGKKLSKGDNITNLSFKTKQIQLTQKIRDGDGQDPVTKRKLTVQDLLRQCDHHGSSARVNAVAGLKELWLSNHQELMQPSSKYGYGAILQKIATMFIDNEAVVRHSVISLFKMIISRISAGHSLPPKGFPVLHIHTYLCCGLNHVHEDIKLDSLLIFDVLLDSLPNLLIEQTGDLLNSLLGFISAPIAIGTRADSTTQRLSLNPDSKLPVMQFRSRVLMRIKKLFQIAVNSKTEQGAEVPDVASVEMQRQIWSIGAGHDGDNTCQDTVVLSPQTHFKFKTLFSGACHELGSYLTEPSSLTYFVTHSITVLLQCWKEARASVDSHSHSGGVLPRDAAEVMALVVTIIQLAFNLCGAQRLKTKCHSTDSDTLVPADVLVTSHATEFEKLFMGSFPYSVQVKASTGKKRKRKHPDSENQTTPFSLDELNLGLCDIMSSFFACSAFTPEQNWCTKMQLFINNSLKKNPSGEQCSTIARCLKNISSSSVVEIFLPSFKAALDYFKSCPVVSTQKKTLYRVFEKICKQWNGQKSGSAQETLSESQLVVEFYSSLPLLLFNVITKKGNSDWALDIVLLMTRAKAQNCSEFMEKLHHILPHYLDSDNGILTCESERVIQQLFFTLSLGTSFSKQHYKQILQALRQPPKLLPRRRSSSLVSHVLQSLYQNIYHLVPLTSQVDFNNQTAMQQSHLSEFLSFMLSLQIGMLKEILDEFSPVTGTASETVKLWEIDFSAEVEHWERHVEIAQVVARQLVSFHIPACPEKGYTETFSLTDSVAQLWMKTFTGRHRIHILSVYSLLVYLSLLSGKRVQEGPSPGFLTFSARVMASVLFHIHSRDHDTGSYRQHMTWAVKDCLLKCLQQSKELLELTWTTLCEIAQEPEWAEATSTVKEFLSSNVMLKQGFEEMQSSWGNK